MTAVSKRSAAREARVSGPARAPSPLRGRPPGTMRVVGAGASLSAWMACSDRGITVTGRPCSSRATSRQVVPLSSRMVSPSAISRETSAAIRRLASTASWARSANGGSSPRSSRVRAPPRKRSRTPCAARVSRSRRMVISEAQVSSASSGTVALPDSFTAWAISRCRSALLIPRLNTTPERTRKMFVRKVLNILRVCCGGQSTGTGSDSLGRPGLRAAARRPAIYSRAYRPTVQWVFSHW
jgi:hypothetical protein